MTTKDAIKSISFKIAYAKQCGEKYAGGIPIEALEIAVRAMAQKRNGIWIQGYDIRCSICNYKLQTTGLLTYCPNCGAEMEV